MHEWDKRIDEFLMRHRDGLPSAVGDLVSRCIIGGCEIDWQDLRKGCRISTLTPDWLPTIADRIGTVFTAVAHGWYCDPFNPPEGQYGRPDLDWVQNRNIWLRWPDRDTGWHWLVPIPDSLPVCEQLTMAEQVFDTLAGDVDATMNLQKDDSPLGVTMQRRGAETIVYVTRDGEDGEVKTMHRMGSGLMRHCFMAAVAQTSDDQEPVGVTAH